MTTIDHKELGNAAFKESKFDVAIEHYTKSLEFASKDTHYVIFSNRAAAFNAINQYENALEDSRKVLELKPDFLKGYLRLAQALKGLGRSKEALDVCKRGLNTVSTTATAATTTPDDNKKPAGYPELTKLAHVLNTELGAKRVAAAAFSSSTNEQEQEMMKEYNELVEDVENLNEILERKVREQRMLQITSNNLMSVEPETKTFIPVGRMFLQRPLGEVKTDLAVKLDKLDKDIELGRQKMMSSETRLKQMSSELQEIMKRHS